MIAPDPDHPNIVYGEKVDKLDTRTGQTRNVDPTLAFLRSIIAAPGHCHSRSPAAAREHCTSPTSASTGRWTAAITGRRSARI